MDTVEWALGMLPQVHRQCGRQRRAAPGPSLVSQESQDRAGPSLLFIVCKEKGRIMKQSKRNKACMAASQALLCSPSAPPAFVLLTLYCDYLITDPPQ